MELTPDVNERPLGPGTNAVAALVVHVIEELFQPVGHRELAVDALMR